jgi:hypothetical protein
VDPILFNADDREAPLGYRLVLGLLVILYCCALAIALGVLGGISWINGWTWTAGALIAADALFASVGAISSAIALPWRWDSLG